MELKIKINTAKGSAAKTSHMIKPFIIGKKKVKHEIYVNKKDNQIIWNVEGHIRDLMSIQRNVNLFDSLMAGILNNKMVKKAGLRDLNPDQMKEFMDMIKNQTSVEVVKRATAEEEDEYNKTWWQRVKEKFKKTQ